MGEHPVIEAMAKRARISPFDAKAAAKVLLKWKHDWASVTDEYHAEEIERFAKHISIELENE